MSEQAISSISVLMPTWQGMQFLKRVFEALNAQECPLPWDLWVTDSGSTDGSFEFIEALAKDFSVPLHLDRIHTVEFDHGDTRNRLAARSAGDLLVFLTQDAIPAGTTWLANLAAEFEDPLVAGAFCRNLPRKDAKLSTLVLSRDDPGWSEGRRVVELPAPDEYATMSPDEKRELYTFQDVASAIRRSAWECHPLPRTSFGEDVLMARAMLEGGKRIVYSDAAKVEHSHDYDLRETHARGAIDGSFNRSWLGRTCIGRAEDVPVLLDRLAPGDQAFIKTLGLSIAAERDLANEVRDLRRAAFEGLHLGGQTAHLRPATRMRPDGDLKLLYVVHGFPPDTWAGTEVFTLGLARGLQALGHQVAIFARAPGIPGGPEDFEVHEGSFEDLRVWRMTHRLDHPNLRASYEQPRAEAAFARVLAREQPDVVHFQHLIHTSTSLVRVAKQAGCATVVHCHDYWGLCARVQLIRPDGVVCAHNMGAGCFACVKERSLDSIPALASLGSGVQAGLVELARRLEKTEMCPQEQRTQAAEFIDLSEREGVVLGAYRDCDLQVSPSRFLRERYLESGVFDPHRFLFSENGLSLEHLSARAKSPRPEGVLRVGFVGSLVWYKGCDVLVDAMSLLAGRSIELFIHGGFDPEADEYHGDLERRAAGTRTKFMGRFDNARLSEVHADLDVLVIPSVWYENAPVTIAEAFACGTPVVASGFGGMAEFVRDGIDGLHFEPADATDLARVLGRLLDEPELLASLSLEFPRPKSVVQDALDWEFRYRALACVERRAHNQRLLAEFSPREAQRSSGEILKQGAEMVLLRPGAVLEFSLEGVPEGPARLEVEQFSLAGELGVRLTGRVEIEGFESHMLPPIQADKEDRAVLQAIDLRLPPGASNLRVVAGEQSSSDGHLRLVRLRLHARPSHES